MAEAINGLALDALVSTGDANRWLELRRPSIEQAGWLTDPLVRAEVLPSEFRAARIAPVVVGLSTLPERRHDVAPMTLVKASIDPAYLATPPTSEFFPHEAIKKHVRDELDRRAGKARGREARNAKTVMFPGYVFPDVAGGTIYLDDALYDSPCTIKAILPAAELIGQMFDMAGIVVGHRPITRNTHTYVPPVSIPAVVRTALTPVKGRIPRDSEAFRRAKMKVLKDSMAE